MVVYSLVQCLLHGLTSICSDNSPGNHREEHYTGCGMAQLCHPRSMTRISCGFGPHPGSFQSLSPPSLLTATRERAVVVAMVTAGITVDIATCCREGKLKDCPCMYPSYMWAKNEDDKGDPTAKYGECGSAVEIAKERAYQIMGIVSEIYLLTEQETVEDTVDRHNAELGAEVSVRPATAVVCRFLVHSWDSHQSSQRKYTVNHWSEPIDSNNAST